MRLLNSLNVSELMSYLYATIYDCTVPGQEDTELHDTIMFPILRLSTRRLLTSRIYLAGLIMH